MNMVTNMNYQTLGTYVARQVMEETHHALGLALKQRTSPLLEELRFALGLALKQRSVGCVGSPKQQEAVQAFINERCVIEEDAVTSEGDFYKAFSACSTVNVPKTKCINITLDVCNAVRKRMTGKGSRAERQVRTRALVGIRLQAPWMAAGDYPRWRRPEEPAA
jgi:hypothetical protein